MASRKSPDDDRLREIVANSMSYQEKREQGYREQALKMFPHICGWCGREFEGARLKELTVHHKDFDHDNNPPDGSNWELLCLYCHEQMHASKSPLENHTAITTETTSTYQPFANLKELINIEDEETSTE